MLNGLDLFSGIGGITRALEPWVRPIAYCEFDTYCQGVLLSRMRSGDIPKAPIWDDVRTLQGSEFPVGAVDIVYGGFPCQEISVAGNGKGLAGERSGLFFEIARIVDEIRPAFVFLENVPAITSRGLGEVTAAFTRLRYDCRWGVVSAYDVEAPHLRKRWFLLARRCENEKNNVANAAVLRCRQGDSNARGNRERKATKKKRLGSPDSGGWWSVEPDVGRVAHGIPFRVDRIRGLGNAVVPLQAREAFKKLIGLGD